MSRVSLNQFDIPRGSVRAEKDGKVEDDYTQWTSVADLTNLRWYFRTYGDQSIKVIDLKKAVDAAEGKVRIIKMEGQQPVADASTDFLSGQQPAQ